MCITSRTYLTVSAMLPETQYGAFLCMREWVINPVLFSKQLPTFFFRYFILWDNSDVPVVVRVRDLFNWIFNTEVKHRSETYTTTDNNRTVFWIMLNNLYILFQPRSSSIACWLSIFILIFYVSKFVTHTRDYAYNQRETISKKVSLFWNYVRISLFTKLARGPSCMSESHTNKEHPGVEGMKCYLTLISNKNLNIHR